MRLSIVTAVCGAIDITEQWFEETIGNCITQPQIVVAANGCTDDELSRLHKLVSRSGMVTKKVNLASIVDVHPSPLGSTASFNRGVGLAFSDIVAMLHNDLMVREPGWDAEVLGFFQRTHNAGVVGFHGARGLGSHDIYKTPYQLTQLARWDTWSNLEDWQAHGAHATEPMPMAVLDGMALIARREDLEAWGGLDESLGAHHMYDNDLALRAMEAGKVNYLLPVRARHLSGQTANRVAYAPVADAEVHRAAHERFYEKWRGKLPAAV